MLPAVDDARPDRLDEQPLAFVKQAELAAPESVARLEAVVDVEGHVDDTVHVPLPWRLSTSPG